MSVAAAREARTSAAAEIAVSARLCDRIVRLHDQLSRLDSLAPAPRVDALFQELVRLCVGAHDEMAASVLSDARIRQARPSLLRICSQGESLLEQAWADRVLEAEDPWAELGRFTYLSNYEQLIRLELQTLAAAGYVPSPDSRVCFLGGGPLPMSALLLHRELGGAVDIVDSEPRAASIARRLLDRLAPGPGLRVVLADAMCAADMAEHLAGCDVVVVAALVGQSRSQKRAVLRAVGRALHSGGYLAIRSANGLRSLLYPVVEPQDVVEAADCMPRVLMHPRSDVVNSVLVALRP
jgi:nicotianamine synthase